MIETMKDRYNIFGHLAALMGMILLVGSCTDELEGMGKGSTRPTDVVCFTASLTDNRSASIARSSSGALEIEQEEWLVGAEEKKDGSRGTPVSLLDGYAGVIGYLYDEWNEPKASVGETPAVTGTTPWEDLYNQKYKFDGDELTAVGADMRWNTIATAANNNHVKFYLYAPFEVTETNGGGALSAETAGGTPTLTYTVNNTVASQKDLIVASWQGNKDEHYGADIKPQSIPLTFEHVLTAVKFKVGFACKVISLKIEGVYNSGTYTFGGEWDVIKSGENITSNYEFNFGEKNGESYTGKDFAANELITDAGNTLMMIPQTLHPDAKVILTYKETADGETKTITSLIGGKVWQKGKMITYTIHQGSAPKRIYFDLAAGNVTITTGTNKVVGYVFEKGATAPKEKTYTHTSGSSYYVYQSTSAKRTATNPTGVLDDETIILPVYDEVTVSENGIKKKWSDFITNNTNVEQVIEAWDNEAGAGQATENTEDNVPANNLDAAGAVRNVGREATKNRIHINGEVKTVNLFIDNIYSSYQERKSAGSDEAVRSRTKGGISFLPSETGESSILTINIIGDNRLGCVNYQNNNPDINGLVFEGTGSLTVADTDYYWRKGEGLGSNRSCSVIGGKDQPETKDDVYNIVFNSGVIYVGAVTSSCTAIGGGGNGNTNITINGGTITAVAKSTGTAIGGGTGLKYEGGIGNVTINNGNVYAYNYRNTSDVPSSAIGGAGSRDKEGSEGNVNIHGGYVYAYSQYGTAIGGGSSAYTWGGDAKITITGGQVIAVSDDGAGIGGGSACTKGKRKDGDTNEIPSYHGGTAEIIINDNTEKPVIRTGSIGGGTSKDPGADGEKSTADDGRLGSADITISGGDIQAQFVMASGSKGTPTFTMNGGTIRNSYVNDKEYKHIQEKGGAVYLEDGTFTMTGGTIKNCSAEQGGAVYIESSAGNSRFLMTGGEITSCFATGKVETDGTVSERGHGGAVCLNGGLVEMLGGKIWNNYTENGDGGGVYIKDGSFSMLDGDAKPGIPEIYSNSTQKGNGGGVYVTSASHDVNVNLLQGIITNNTANNFGGGICVDMGSTTKEANVTVGKDGQGVTEADADPKISGNASMMSGGGLYVRGAKANVAINSGMIHGNSVSAHVKNPDVTNEEGSVELNKGLVTHVVVTYDGNDGKHKDDSNVTSYTQNIVTNTNSKLKENCFVLNGHKFVGWNTHKDGIGVSYPADFAEPLSSDLKLYAMWEPIQQQ